MDSDLSPIYLDTDSWPRRDAFAYFKGFDKPYFNVCVRLDVAPLKAALRDRGGGASLMLAYHYIVLKLANASESFRLRLEGGRVRVHPAVHGGLTVLRDDGSFGFAYVDWKVADSGAADAFDTFARHAAAAIDASRRRQVPFDPRQDDEALLHFTTLPWVHFSSFSHARNWGRQDSVPKIAFGRIDADPHGPQQWLPCSVEVHHALMDGAHVGQFMLALEDALRAPQGWL